MSVEMQWQRRFWPLVSALLAISCINAGHAQTPPAVASEPQAAAAPPTPRVVALRPLNHCTGDPKFLSKFGLTRKALVDTSSSDIVGLSVLDVDDQGQYTRRSAHPSWSQAGYLGRVQRDRAGHIYTYPAPSISLEKNPIERANIIYRVDSETGVMAPFAELPRIEDANKDNPYGLLALALDCEVNALYAATVYGSSASQERGLIAKVDLATRRVSVVARDIDALSLAVVREATGKRLYVGTARDGQLLSYAIDEARSSLTDERVELRLNEVPAARDRQIRVIRVTPAGDIYLRAMPFDYSLTARTSTPVTELHYRKTGAGMSLVSAREAELSPTTVIVPTLPTSSPPPQR